MWIWYDFRASWKAHHLWCMKWLIMGQSRSTPGSTHQWARSQSSGLETGLRAASRTKTRTLVALTTLETLVISLISYNKRPLKRSVCILNSRAWLMGSTHWCLSTITTTRGAEVLLPTRTGTFTSWQWHSWYDVTRHAWIHYFLTIQIWNIFKSWGKTTDSRGSCRLTTSTTTMQVRPEASPTGVRETAEMVGSASTGGTP